jgi:site-specific recombinase XerD
MSDPTSFSLLKRSNGFWYVLYETDGRIRWKSTHTRSKQEATRSLSNLKDLLKPRSRVILLSKFIQDFLLYAIGTYSAKTTSIYRGSLGSLKAFVGDLPLTSLTARHLDSYKADRLLSVSPVSVNIELRTLKAAMNVAVRWQMLEANPFRGSPLVRVPERSPSYFSKEEFQKLLSLIKENWLKELIVFAVLTGMRRGEIVNLKWADVDLSRKAILVRSSSTFKTKQGKQRVVPLSDVAFHLLSSKAVKSDADYVFSRHGRNISGSFVAHKLKHYVYEAKLTDHKLHFHSLRHTFASWLIQDGVSLYEVQKLLGHSNISVTQVYSHLQPAQLYDAVNRVKLLEN